jgi:hypothetical protein
MELCLAVSISANSLQTQIMQVIGDVDGSMNKSFDCQKGGGDRRKILKISKE